MPRKKKWMIFSLVVLGVLLIVRTGVIISKEDRPTKTVRYTDDQDVDYISARNGSTGLEMVFDGAEKEELLEMIQGIEFELPLEDDSTGYSYYIDVHYTNVETGKRLTLKYPGHESIEEWLDLKYEDYFYQ